MPPHANREIFLTANRLASILPSGIWAHLSLLADATAVIAILSLFVFKYPNFAVISIWGGALLGIFGQIIKRTADIKRPAAILPDTDFQIIGDPLFAHAFPSGHSFDRAPVCILRHILLSPPTRVFRCNGGSRYAGCKFAHRGGSTLAAGCPCRRHDWLDGRLLTDDSLASKRIWNIRQRNHADPLLRRCLAASVCGHPPAANRVLCLHRFRLVRCRGFFQYPQDLCRLLAAQTKNKPGKNTATANLSSPPIRKVSGTGVT